MSNIIKFVAGKEFEVSTIFKAKYADEEHPSWFIVTEVMSLDDENSVQVVAEECTCSGQTNDKKFCFDSGCEYYYGEIDECMFGEPEIPTDLIRKCIENNNESNILLKENEHE